MCPDQPELGCVSLPQGKNRHAGVTLAGIWRGGTSKPQPAQLGKQEPVIMKSAPSYGSAHWPKAAGTAIIQYLFSISRECGTIVRWKGGKPASGIHWQIVNLLRLICRKPLSSRARSALCAHADLKIRRLPDFRRRAVESSWDGSYRSVNVSITCPAELGDPVVRVRAAYPGEKRVLKTSDNVSIWKSVIESGGSSGTRRSSAWIHSHPDSWNPDRRPK